MVWYLVKYSDSFTFILMRHTKKVKVKLFLCLTTHHAMKTYWGCEGIAPHNLNLGAESTGRVSNLVHQKVIKRMETYINVRFSCILKRHFKRTLTVM
jgi:hypothetical protein